MVEFNAPHAHFTVIFFKSFFLRQLVIWNTVPLNEIPILICKPSAPDTVAKDKAKHKIHKWMKGLHTMLLTGYQNEYEQIYMHYKCKFQLLLNLRTGCIIEQGFI